MQSLGSVKRKSVSRDNLPQSRDCLEAWPSSPRNVSRIGGTDPSCGKFRLIVEQPEHDQVGQSGADTPSLQDIASSLQHYPPCPQLDTLACSASIQSVPSRASPRQVAAGESMQRSFLSILDGAEFGSYPPPLAVACVVPPSFSDLNDAIFESHLECAEPWARIHWD
jgi:hypothetical protein